MPVPAATRRTLAPLAIVTVAALLFTLLLLLVRLQWAPLESVDHGAAAPPALLTPPELPAPALACGTW